MPAPKNPLDCFPSEARRWIARDSAGKGEGVVPGHPSKRSAMVYVDRSGSMAGYLAGATNLERPFQDIVSTLPGALALYGIDTSFRSFGTRISENLPAAGQHLLEPAVYSCAGIHRENCDNSESRLDHVFEQIKAGNNDLAVVVSDLWFTNSEIRSSGLAALQPMLSDLLFSGKVIAVYGISAPFDGAIYDLPDEGTEKFSVPYTGRHPLYIVVVGSKPAVLDFDKALGNSGSKYLSEGRTNGAIQRTLFAVDPGPDAPVETAPLGKSSDSRIKLSKFSVTPGVAIQRFSMTKAPASPMRANAAGPTWVGPKPGSFLDDAVWAGPMRVRTRIWTKSGNACSAKSWLAQNEGVAGWHSEVTDGLATFTLDSKRFAAALSAKGTYLVTGEVQRTSLTLPNPRTEWMRGSWSLDPARAMMVAQRPPREFPTLNLSEFGRIMETALATAAERRNKPIIGFTFMVKVDD